MLTQVDKENTIGRSISTAAILSGLKVYSARKPLREIECPCLASRSICRNLLLQLSEVVNANQSNKETVKLKPGQSRVLLLLETDNLMRRLHLSAGWSDCIPCVFAMSDFQSYKKTKTRLLKNSIRRNADHQPLSRRVDKPLFTAVNLGGTFRSIHNAS